MYIKRASEIYNDTFCLALGQCCSQTWTQDQAISDLAEREQDRSFTYVWISDPALLGDEPSDQELVFTLWPIILKANGRMHQESYRPLKDTAAIVQEGAKSKHKHALVPGGPPLAWVAMLGATLPSATVFIGKPWKADKEAPEGVSVVRAGDKLFAGAVLARLSPDERVATFTPETLTAETERMAKLLGKTAQLRVLSGAELVSS